MSSSIAVEETRQKLALQVRAEHLIEIRERAGLTQEEVAEAIEVSWQCASAIENSAVAG
jgi:DNA-binding XRE family transcriptional regulator